MARGRQLPSEPAGQAPRSGHGPARPRRRSPQAILTSEARLRAVVSNAPVILFATDSSGTFTLSEGKGLARLGLTPGEVVGQSVFDLYTHAIIHGVRRALAGETVISTSEVGELVYETYYAPILDRRGRVAGVVGVATDVTERAQALERLMEHARRDSLTGVLNHGAITGYLAEQLERADLEHVAVAMIDVDGMKAVNDTYGHLSGDAVLQTVAGALASDDAVVGRYGGDEFLVVLAGADRGRADAYVRRAVSEIRETKVTDEETGAIIRLPASIGIAIFPDEAATLVELIKAADRAMYAAKRSRALENGEVVRRRDDRVSAMIADLVPLLTSPGDLDEKLKLVGSRLSAETGYDAVDCQIFRSHGRQAGGTLRQGVDDALAQGWRAQQQAHADIRQRAINVILAKTRRPVILEDLSSDDRLTSVERALLAQAGLRSAVIAPMLWDDELAGTVAVASKRKAAFDPRDAEFLAAVANQVTAIVRMASLVDGLQSATERLSDAQAQTVMMLAAAAEAHDHTTGIHLESVRAFAEAIAREMGYAEDAVRDLGLAATLHDIGKIRVPDNILASLIRFDSDDWEVARVWEVMKQHSIWGAEFLEMRPEFALAAKVARWHHERWDGRGYPDGIAGEQIPEEVTIVTVADAFDAMVSERPYRAARPVEEALAEIVECRGIQFNPAVVDALVRLYHRGALPDRIDHLRMAA
jgi:diguanylate cyclase (GGDEF)-like protein/PAS domain S-box-containing protein